MYTYDLNRIPPSKKSKQVLYYDPTSYQVTERLPQDLHKQIQLYPDLERSAEHGRNSSRQILMEENPVEMFRRSQQSVESTRSELPLDLTTQSSTTRIITADHDHNQDHDRQFGDDQTFFRSGKSVMVNAFRATPGQDKTSTTLPLFVNQENARLDAMSNDRSHGSDESEENLDRTGFFNKGDFYKHQLFGESETELAERAFQAASWKKSSIVRLKKHLERRQESKPVENLPSPGIISKTISGREADFPRNRFYQEMIRPSTTVNQTLSLSMELIQGRQSQRKAQNASNSDGKTRFRYQIPPEMLDQEPRTNQTNRSSFDPQWSLTSASSIEQLLLTTKPSIVLPSSGIKDSELVQSLSPASLPATRSTNPSDRISPDTRSMPEFEPDCGRQPINDGLRDRNIFTSDPSNQRGDGSPNRVEREMPDESFSPDQSTDSVGYRRGNIPSIIDSVRLSDESDFRSEAAPDAGGVKLLDRSVSPPPSHSTPSGAQRPIHAGVLMRLQMTMAGPGKRSSPEQPTSTFDEDPDLKIKSDSNTGSRSSSDSSIPCKICQDVANGFHYGVWSCEGCKAFFKRSITGSARYVCPADNSCTINRLRKKSCQACRLRKCYEFGMSPGNCRGENGAKHGRKRKFQEEQMRKSEAQENTKQNCFDKWKMTDLKIGSSDQRDNAADLSKNQPTDDRTISVKIGNALQSPSLRTDRNNNKNTNGILDYLMSIERPIHYADYDEDTSCPGSLSPSSSGAASSSSSSSLKVITSLMKLVNTQLLDIVKWSLDLPGFRDLDINIRTQMLISSWSDVLLLTNAFHSVQASGTFIMAPNLQLNKEKCETIGIMSLYNRLMRIVRTFRSLEITHDEMLLLQVIILVNSEFVMPQMFPQVDELRANLIRALNETRIPSTHQSSNPHPYNGNTDHAAQLLLILPQLKHCSLQFLSILSEVSKDSRIPTYSLLQDVMGNRREVDHISILDNNNNNNNSNSNNNNNDERRVLIN